jgi:hypothetical protein
MDAVRAALRIEVSSEFAIPSQVGRGFTGKNHPFSD